MKELKLGKPTGGGSPAGGETGFLDIDTSEGRQRLVFTDEMAEELIWALRQVQGLIQTERLKAGKHAIQHRYVVEIDRFEFLLDQLNEVAVVRTRYKNGASQDLAIERKLIPEVAKFLTGAVEKFESQSKTQRQ